MPDLFFLVDSDSRIIDFKTGDTGALYRKPEQFLGKRMSDVLPAGVGSQISAKLAETLEQQSLTSFEYSMTIDRELQHFEARIAPIDATHAALIARNITARKTAHQQLQERMKELDGLYKTYRLIQIETDLEHLAPAVLQVIAEAMQAPDEVHASISIDGRCWEHGDDSADGQIISAPIKSPKDKAARITVRFNQRTPPVAEEEEVLRAVATAIELWLKDDEAQAQLELYQRVVADTRDQIALIDHRLHYKMVNAAYAARLGLNPEELIGKAVGSVIEDQLFTDTIEPKLKEALTGSSVQYQQWRPQPDGSRAYMNVLYTPYKEHRGVRGVIASMHDITDLYQAQEQLRRAARVFSSSAEAVLMTDVDGAITDVNEAFEKIAGYKLEDVVGQHYSILESGRHPPSFFSAIFNDIERTGFWHGEMWNKRRSGEVFPCLITVSQVLSEEGELSGYVAVFSDISSIKDNEHRLELLAHHDPLTGAQSYPAEKKPPKPHFQDAQR
ncbi:sensory box protein [gamma proteobacterium NOR5-3]|nr:sensory box protein [gamma proteobacterium NOR5-3]